MSETRYEVQEGDSLESIAEQHQIDQWEDLWDHNKAALAERGITTPDVLKAADGEPVVLLIPDDRDHELGRKLLKDRKVPLSKYMGGASWLDPRGVVSVTIHDDRGDPIPDGTEVAIHDPVLDITRVETSKDGHVMVRLPRKDWTLQTMLFPGFEEELGGFRERAPKGDAGKESLDDFEVHQAEPPPEATSRSVQGDWDRSDDDAAPPRGADETCADEALEDPPRIRRAGARK